MAKLSKKQITAMVDKSYGYIVDADGLRDQRSKFTDDTDTCRDLRSILSAEAHTYVTQADGICTAAKLIGCYEEYNDQLQEKLRLYEGMRYKK